MELETWATCWRLSLSLCPNTSHNGFSLAGPTDQPKTPSARLLASQLFQAFFACCSLRRARKASKIRPFALDVPHLHSVAGSQLPATVSLDLRIMKLSFLRFALLPNWCRCAAAVVVVVCGNHRAIAQSGEAEQVDFRQHIQPLLSRDCFACHGPDEETRQGDLRLDIEAAAKQHAIVAGDAQASPLIARIFADDSGEVMPPPETGHQLTTQEKQLLKQWIEQGAAWQSHWAFEPIAATAIASELPASGENAIDYFIAKQRQTQKLEPAPPADKVTLLRRLYLDLVGLPPTPQQRERFLADSSPKAYENVVDELLDSPHFGEQMAVAWLDAARFADTNGYQNDFNRSMWPWRDWVIDAFNRNLPYDQFIVQQIAGDMLPEPTQDALVATGFNRNNRSVTEGGTIEEEWRIENCVDRVETTTATFLGLTMGCARCHDHKYDPITQKEFYQFFAFFNNIDENGVYFETRGNVGPQLTVPTAEQSTRLDELQQQLANAKRELDTQPPEELLRQWSAETHDPKRATLPNVQFAFSQPASDGVHDSLMGTSPVAPSFVLDGTMDSLGQTPQPDFTFASHAPFSWSVWIQGEARGAIFGKMNEDDGYRGVDGLILGDGRLKIHLIDQWPHNAIAVISKTALRASQWNCVTVTYDGQSKAAGLRVYFDGQAVETEVEQDGLSGSLATEVAFKIGQRSKSEFLQGELADFRIYAAQLTPPEVLVMIRQTLAERYQALQGAGATADILAITTDYVRAIDDNPMRQKLNDLQSEYDRQLAQAQTTMIMRDRPQYRETYLLKRGQYDQPDKSQPLWPAVPAALPPLSVDQPPNRLGLAAWMVDARNPLVARVAVNRAWLKFFGRGLVESVDNFGVQGSPPTHPLLLDWLADDFRKNGWDLKRLHKQMVMSATYQQSSDVSEARLAQDPSNRFYARGPRYRLSAEQVRDAALSRAGLLVERLGGPPVFPYQPAGLWDELAGGANGGPYVQSTGPDLYRRSLYTFRKRTVSHPVLATFDAPSWEICQLKRARTNTPLQALALLNDVTYVEAARKLAERMLLEPQATEPSSPANSPTAIDSTASDRAERSIRYGFDLVTLRQPTPAELQTLVQGFQNYLEYYEHHPDQAKELSQVGDSPVDSSLAEHRLAAMTAIAAILLNLDEALTKE